MRFGDYQYVVCGNVSKIVMVMARKTRKVLNRKVNFELGMKPRH